MLITLAATVLADLDTDKLPVKVVAPVTARVELIVTEPVTARVCVAVTGLLNENPPLEVNAITPVFTVTRIRSTLLTPGLVKSM